MSLNRSEDWATPRDSPVGSQGAPPWPLRYQLVPAILLLVLVLGYALAPRETPTRVDRRIGTQAGVAPSISADSAVASAVNQLRATGDGWRIEHRRHVGTFTATGLDFAAHRGPRWRFELTSVRSGDAPIAGIHSGPVRPESPSPTTVSYPRGRIEERFVARPHGIELQYLLHQPVTHGSDDLEIEGRIDSDGRFEVTESGWLWRQPAGVVSLGDVTVFDAEGSRLAARMLVTADRLRIVVEGTALLGAIYPVTVDPEIGTNDFRISEMGTDGDAARDGTEAAVTFNNIDGEYLVVWRGDGNPLANDDHQIFAQRIDALTGARLGPALRVSDAGVGAPGQGAAAPAVAFNPSRREYLVVWSDDAGSSPGRFEILGQRLDADPGSFGPVGADDFRVSDFGLAGNRDFGAFDPAVAYNPTDDEYLVVWHGDFNAGGLASGEHEIFGQRLDADPSSFGPIGSNDFRISDMGAFDGNQTFGAFNAAVTFNSLAREFLVVWHGDDDTSPLVDGEYEIFGQRLDADPGSFGEVGGNDFRISDMGPNGNTSFGAFDPDVDHNGVSDGYLVVWSGDDAGGSMVDNELEIFGQRLDATGAQAGANDFRISDMGGSGNPGPRAVRPAVVHGSADDEYLVTWQGDDAGSGEDEIYGQSLNALGGAVGANDFRISDMGPNGSAAFDAASPAVAYDPGQNWALVVWDGDDDAGALVDGEREVYGQLVGRIADLEVFKSVTPDPAVAGFLLTYQVTVTNHGPTEAIDVALSDPLPPDTTFVSASPSAGGTCSTPAVGGTGTVACLWAGATAVAASRTLDLVVDVGLGAPDGSTLSNTATASSGTSDPDPLNNAGTIDVTVVNQADISVTKADSKDPAAPGDPLTYTVSVFNGGPSPATVVVATDTLPPFVSFLSTTGCANDPAGVPACDLGTLGVGSSAVYTIDVDVDVLAPSGSLFNTVSVATATVDPVAAGNDFTEETVIDADPPTVALVDSAAGTGDGELQECESTRAAITRLFVTFDEPVQDPPGDSDPSDVTNPANYRLLAAGPDGDFSTQVCGPAVGDDALIPIDTVSYDGGTLTAVLDVNGGQPLTDALHRLLACGSTSIRDVAGNALDGDYDGIRGDDFLRTYRVDRANLFDNGHFDCELDPWIAVSTVPAEIVHSPDDLQDSTQSGSVAVSNLTASTGFSLGQCPPVNGGSTYVVSGSARVDVAAGVPLFLSRSCQSFSGPQCTGTSLVTAIDFSLLADTAGAWEPLFSLVAAPPAAQSILCTLDLSTPGGDLFDVNLDDLSLSLFANPIFMDGFETGDLSRWSSSSP